MRLRFLAPGLVASATVLASCSTEPTCTQDIRPAIEVTILALTGYG
jgi:predicted small secreted protein